MINFINSLNYLKTFRQLPTYQFERRIDAFILPYLEQVINTELELNDKNLKLVYPEFPLKRTNNIEKIDRQSEYADYLLWSPLENKIILVEFKTDIKSINQTQFNTYNNNCKYGWENLIRYYIDKINDKNWRKFI